MQKKITPLIKANISLKAGSPYSETYSEHYFSNIGAIAEKTHVFLEGNHLSKRFQTLNNQSTFIIGEIGFGLAINFLLTWQLWHTIAPKDKHLHYVSTEINPLQKNELQKILNNFPELASYSKQLINFYPSLTPGIHRIHFGNVSLTLLLGDANEQLKTYISDFNAKRHNEIKSFSVDCWYLDGFSPTKNQQAWTQSLLTTINLLSNKNTTLSSYSVSKVVKNGIESAGFSYMKKPGIGKKREFLTAIFLDLPKPSSHIKKEANQAAPWHCNKYLPPLKKNESIAIIGAGLAGCIVAFRLAERGFKVSLFDKASSVAQKGSGNALGMVHFNLSAYHSPLNDFMLCAYTYALRFYKSLNLQTQIKGIADLLSDEKFLIKQEQLAIITKAHPEIIQFLNVKQTTKIANINISKPSLYWPNALIISPIEICNLLSQHENIELKLNHDIDITQLKFDKIILCTGTSTTKINSLGYLPIENVPGMVSYFNTCYETSQLTIGLTDKGYITPALKGQYHVVGGSYHIKDIEQSHQAHRSYAVSISPIFKKWHNETPHYKQGSRAKTYDYLPYVGPLFDSESFNAHYKSLAQDKNKKIEEPYINCDNKYILTGFGSHGLTTIPLCAEILLCQLLNEPLPISQSMMKSLSPARSLIRNLIKKK